MIIVPNDGDDDEAESELRWLSCDERKREVESELRSWLSCDGDKGERQRVIERVRDLRVSFQGYSIRMPQTMPY